jgi:hypothetical protein
MKIETIEQRSTRWYELDMVCRSLTQSIARADAAGLPDLTHRLLMLKQDVLAERERQ